MSNLWVLQTVESISTCIQRAFVPPQTWSQYEIIKYTCFWYVNSLLIKLVLPEVGTAKQILPSVYLKMEVIVLSWTENSDFTNIKQEINLQFSHLRTSRLDFIYWCSLLRPVLFFINEMKQTHEQQDDPKWAFPHYAKYISNPKWCITRNFSVDK